MQAHEISGLPVVEAGKKSGKLVGILTNRDVRFATDMNETVGNLMTRQDLITVQPGVGQQRGPQAAAPAPAGEAAGGR